MVKMLVIRAADLRRRLVHFARPGLPKYVALHDAIVASISSGHWPGGSRLPTESEWAAELPVSLGTIQRALRMLADEGLVVRRQGAGSFVAQRDVGRMHAPLHCRFLNDSRTDYLPVYPKVLKRYEITRNGPWSRHLGASRLLCIDRVLSINNEFNVFSRFYVDAARLPAFSRLPTRKLSGENFKEIIWRENRQPIGRIVQFLSTITLSREICEAIGLKPGTKGQLLEISAFAGRDSPIYYQEIFIPPNRRRHHLAGDGRDQNVNERG